MSDHIDDSTTDEEIEATVMRDQIRELDEHYKAAWDEICRLQKSIDKAKAILEVTALDSESSWARTKAKEALEALEGK